MLSEETGADLNSIIALKDAVETYIHEHPDIQETDDKIMEYAMTICEQHGITQGQLQTGMALMEARANDENRDEVQHHDPWAHCLEGKCTSSDDMDGKHTSEDCCENVRLHKKRMELQKKRQGCCKERKEDWGTWTECDRGCELEIDEEDLKVSKEECDMHKWDCEWINQEEERIQRDMKHAVLDKELREMEEKRETECCKKIAREHGMDYECSYECEMQYRRERLHIEEKMCKLENMPCEWIQEQHDHLEAEEKEHKAREELQQMDQDCQDDECRLKVREKMLAIDEENCKRHNSPCEWVEQDRQMIAEERQRIAEGGSEGGAPTMEELKMIADHVGVPLGNVVSLAKDVETHIRALKDASDIEIEVLVKKLAPNYGITDPQVEKALAYLEEREEHERKEQEQKPQEQKPPMNDLPKEWTQDTTAVPAEGTGNGW